MLRPYITSKWHFSTITKWNFFTNFGIQMSKIIVYLESVISGERSGIFPSFLRIKLLLISYLTLGMVKIRRWLYSRGLLRSENLPCKVISVGNVVVGGSGKTPTVIAIAKLLKEDSDLKIAVVSRGYRSKTKGNAIVSDGNSVLLDSALAGDEPYLLAQNLSGIPVLIGKDRIKSISEAIGRWGIQVAILDDGFQYLKMVRDVNIVTIDSTSPFGFYHLLPRGYLREPLSALKNADLILLTRTDQCKNLNEVKRQLQEIASSVPIFESVHQPTCLMLAEKNQDLGLDYIKNKNVLAVCGIANHLSFIETLNALNPAKITPVSFPDHHEYTNDDIRNIGNKAIEINANMIVTTEKDAYKIREITACPVLILKIELKLICSSTDKFLELIKQRCEL